MDTLWGFFFTQLDLDGGLLLCQRWLKALPQDACPSGEGDLHMLAALRRAGSALPRHAASRMRERQSRRRCLPAELTCLRRLSAC